MIVLQGPGKPLREKVRTQVRDRFVSETQAWFSLQQPAF